MGLSVVLCAASSWKLMRWTLLFCTETRPHEFVEGYGLECVETVKISNGIHKQFVILENQVV